MPVGGRVVSGPVATGQGNRAQRRAARRRKFNKGAYLETARRYGDLNPDELAVLAIMTELADDAGRITLNETTLKAALDDPDRLAVLLALADDAAEGVAPAWG